MSTVLTRPAQTDRKPNERRPTERRSTGRHRLGRPGLIPVTALVTVVRRGLLGSWLRPGRHRMTTLPAARQVRNRPPVPAAV